MDDDWSQIADDWSPVEEKPKPEEAAGEVPEKPKQKRSTNIKRRHRVTPGPKPEQRFFIESLIEQGYRAVVRNGSDDAFETLSEYLNYGPFKA